MNIYEKRLAELKQLSEVPLPDNVIALVIVADPHNPRESLGIKVIFKDYSHFINFSWYQ